MHIARAMSHYSNIRDQKAATCGRLGVVTAYRRQVNASESNCPFVWFSGGTGPLRFRFHVSDKRSITARETHVPRGLPSLSGHTHTFLAPVVI